jgi:L-2-hydroxyglutarate oxidase
MKADIIIIGANIVAPATAHKTLTMTPGRKALIVEKEDTVARHRTCHNKGVGSKIAGPTPLFFIP